MKTDDQIDTKKAKSTKDVNARNISVYTESGDKKGEITLRLGYTPKPSHEVILNRYIYSFLVNQRKGTAHTKTRSEIRGTTKKVYRQKGTGRARHGSEKAPIFVGGGVVGGPRKKYYHASFPKKQKRIALLYVLNEKLKPETTVCLENSVADMKINTKTAATLLSKLSMGDKKILFISPEKKKSNIYYSMRNIPQVSITSLENINPYILLHHNAIVMCEETVSRLQTVISPEK